MTAAPPRRSPRAAPALSRASSRQTRPRLSGGNSTAVREQLVGFLAGVADDEMQVDTPAAPAAADKAAETPAEKTEEEKTKEKEEAAFVRKMQGVPEAEIFVQLLFTIFLLDKKQVAQATSASASLIQRAQHFNRRTTDQLLSKGYFYWARCVEITGQSAQIRDELLAAYRTASLKHDQIGQATLLNLLLRNYLEFNLYEQADTLMRKTSFPEGDASNNQLARYLYYTGRIKAVQLEYTDAFRSLQQAARKAPQTSALGFRKTVHKFIVVVQLLLGEIPEFDSMAVVTVMTMLEEELDVVFEDDEVDGEVFATLGSLSDFVAAKAG